MSIENKTVLITGASLGIGKAIALALGKEAANLILFARSEDKLASLKEELTKTSPSLKVWTYSVDVQSHSSVNKAVEQAVGAAGKIDVLINNAGLAIGAPARFHELKLSDIDTMVGTNINGYLYVTHAVLNAGGMAARGSGTILNVTSVTGLEVPPFPGEAVYHSSKAAQEAFTNVLRTELQDTSIKVVALRPGVVATHFHELRVGYDKKMYNDFIEGYEPLVAEDIAEAAVYMLKQDERVSIKALDIVPTAQRTLQVFDRNWNKRHGIDS